MPCPSCLALPVSPLRRLALLATVVAVTAAPASAATRSWDGGGALNFNYNWANTANWTTGVAPVANDALVFTGNKGAASNTNNITAGTQFNGITFNSGAGAFSLDGNAVTLGGDVTNNATNPQTITLNVALAGSPRAFNAASGNLVVSGTVSGTVGLLKAGSGTLTLSAPNSYSGGTTLSAGTIVMGTAGALGSGTVATTGGSGLTAGVSGTIPNVVTLGSGTTSFDTQAFASTLTGSIGGAGRLRKLGSGTLALNGNNAFSGGASLDAGVLRYNTSTALGSGSVVVTGTATLQAGVSGTLANAIALSSSTTLATFDTQGFASGVSAAITGAGSLIKSGTGSLALSGLNTYSGTTAILAGSLSVASVDGSGGASGIGTGSSAVVLGDATHLGTLDYTGGDATFSRGFAIAAGGGRVNVETAGQTLTISAGNVSGTAGGSFTVGGAGNTVISSTINPAGLGGLLTKEGSGRLTITGVNTADTVAIAGGTFAIGRADFSGGVLSNVTTTTITNGATLDVGSFAVAANAVQLINGSIVGSGTLSCSSDLVTTSGTVSTTLDPGSQFNIAGIRQLGGGTTVITSSNSLNALVEVLAGGILNVRNPYAIASNNSSSVIVRTGGLLELQQSGTLQGMSSVVVQTASGSNAHLIQSVSGTNGISSQVLISSTATPVQGNVLISTEADRLTLAGGIGIFGGGAYSGTLTVDGAGDTVVSSLNLSSGRLIKDGAGTLTLSGSTTLSGTTTITAGVLQIGIGGTTGSIPGSVLNNGSLVFDRSDAVSVNNLITGTGSLWQIGSGTLTLSSTSFSNSYSGGTRIAAGTVSLDDLAALGSGAVTFAGNATLLTNLRSGTVSNAFALEPGVVATVDTGGQSLILDQPIDGAGSLKKLGNGILFLNGSNSYAGGTTLARGEIRAGNTQALGSGTVSLLDGVFLRSTFSGTIGNPVVVSSGTVYLEPTGNALTLSGVVSGSGVASVDSPGVLTLATRASFTGLWRISGKVVTSGSDTLASASTIRLASGTLDASAAGIAVGSGQVLGGKGTFVGTLDLLSGGTISPTLNEAFPATFSQASGNATWSGGCHYRFAINNATGTSGTTSGWSLFSTTGSLSLAAGSGSSSQIVMDLTSLSGTVANFSSAGHYAWKFASAGSAISAYDPSWFRIDTSGFRNAASGQFSVSRGDLLPAEFTAGSANDLYVVYTTAVPEPSTVGIAAAGLAAIGCRLRRRRTSASLRHGGAANRCLVVALIALAAVSAHPASAATRTWDGGGVLNFNYNWSNNANWTASVAPVANDSLVFTGNKGATSNTNNITAGTQFNGITFNSGAGAFSLDGNAITLGGDVTNNATNTQTITVNLAITGSNRVFNSASGPLVVSGSVSGGFGILKTGTGTLTLSGTNSFTGGATVSAGSLVGSSASLRGEIAASAGTGVTFNQATSGTYSGNLSGGGSLTKTGAGALTFSGSNSYSGGTTLSAGTLALASPGSLGSSGTISFGGGGILFSASNTTDYSSRFSTAAGQQVALDTNGQSVTLASALTSAGGSLTKAGAGTLTLTGANT